MASSDFVQVAKCKVDGCNKPASVKGYCTSHYRRLMLHGDPMFTKRQFHGTTTKVLGISLPTAIAEAANIAGAKQDMSGVSFLAAIIAKSSWGKAVLDEAGVDLKKAAGLITLREPVKPAVKRRGRPRKVTTVTVEKTVEQTV